MVSQELCDFKYKTTTPKTAAEKRAARRLKIESAKWLGCVRDNVAERARYEADREAIAQFAPVRRRGWVAGNDRFLAMLAVLDAWQDWQDTDENGTRRSVPAGEKKVADVLAVLGFGEGITGETLDSNVGEFFDYARRSGRLVMVREAKRVSRNDGDGDAREYLTYFGGRPFIEHEPHAAPLCWKKPKVAEQKREPREQPEIDSNPVARPQAGTTAAEELPTILSQIESTTKGDPESEHAAKAAVHRALAAVEPEGSRTRDVMLGTAVWHDGRHVQYRDWRMGCVVPAADRWVKPPRGPTTSKEQAVSVVAKTLPNEPRPSAPANPRASTSGTSAGRPPQKASPDRSRNDGRGDGADEPRASTSGTATTWPQISEAEQRYVIGEIATGRMTYAEAERRGYQKPPPIEGMDF